MNSEQQYISLYNDSSELIKSHSADVMNALRDSAFESFKRLGFPSRKVERYKYTDMAKLFAPDYGLNLKRLEIPVDPYEAFRCDVPNLSTSLYFVVNDQFYTKALPKVQPAMASSLILSAMPQRNIQSSWKSTTVRLQRQMRTQ